MSDYHFLKKIKPSGTMGRREMLSGTTAARKKGTNMNGV